MRRVIGVLWHPRQTMTDVVARPSFALAWVFVLAVVAACAFALLSTTVGKQALVDERVRVIEALGGRVDDAAYGALQAKPPWLVYWTSGGRLLLTPEMTLLVAVGLVALARLDGARVRYVTALAVTVHATVVLAVQQVITTPLHYVRESLTSPTNLAGLMPMLDEGSMPARWLGSIDVFGLWWVWLLAVGLAAATGRPVGRYVGRLLMAYVGVAAIVAVTFAVLGAQ
ncbi:YIP1 family protein [Phenylobacterium sp.]|uniref:YIP1 family protein n=1 Tax=Phenylobacterium sp. TaxID=1871053 RepID=UPI00272FEBFD|nr:YIP1 family protein [Phenylobacterium sp.]MDP1987122.1 YIP1 family protein [Phenylobacterium sp.]